MGRTLNIAPLSSPTASSLRPHEPAENEAALAGVVIVLDDDLLVLAFLVMVVVEAVRPQHITVAPALPLELRPASQSVASALQENGDTRTATAYADGFLSGPSA